MGLHAREAALAVIAAIAVVASRAEGTGTGMGTGNAGKYQPNWPSLMTRPLPQWFDDSKIGVFMHWGVYSVPSYDGRMPAEWYWHALRGGFSGCCGTQVDPVVQAFHNKTYGPDFDYSQFAPMFTADFFDPDEWAGIFKDAGIRYVVLTSKHHDGFANWCSAEAWNWNACDLGPKRDLVGELTASVKAAGLHMGLYLSMFEWYHPLFLQDRANGFNTSTYVDQVYLPQAKEINNLYRPDLIWSDGDFATTAWWKAPEFVAWLYNEAPNRDTVVINDRWGSDNPPIGSGKHFGGYFSGKDRQSASSQMLGHKWESAFTIDSHNCEMTLRRCHPPRCTPSRLAPSPRALPHTGVGWLAGGYARNSPLSMYLTIEQVLFNVVSTVAFGGNVLINIGPTADGRIPTIFQERLAQLGRWLGVNGGGIYNSTKWRVTNDTGASAVDGTGVFYTASKADPSHVYAFSLTYPGVGNAIELSQPVPSANTTVELLGCNASISWRPNAQHGGMELIVPAMSQAALPRQLPWVFRLTGIQ